MKYIFYIIIIAIVSSCGIFRKVEKLSQETKTSYSEVKDTTSSVISSIEIIQNMIKKIDQSSAKITEYNAPDSTGKQSIIRTIDFSNNVVTTDSSKRVVQNDYSYSNIKNVVTKDSLYSQQSKNTVLKVKSNSVYLYLILIALGSALGVAFKDKIVLLFKRIGSIFV